MKLRLNKVKYLFVSMRPHQQVKNFFVFAALVFSKHLFDYSYFIKTLAAFFVFCLASAGVYVVNDIHDIPYDRSHPYKKNRPFASGALSTQAGWLWAGFLFSAALVGGYSLGKIFFLILLIYLLLQLCYSFFLKDIVIVDIFVVALGFVLRVVSGAAVINVEASSWFVACVMLLSLFMVLGRRRYEMHLIQNGTGCVRKVMNYYNTHFIDQMISVVTSTTFLAYLLYTLSPETIQKFHTHYLFLTSFFVLYGIFRYLFIVYYKQEGGAPERVILSDRSLIVAVVCWILSVIIIIYRC